MANSTAALVNKLNNADLVPEARLQAGQLHRYVPHARLPPRVSDNFVYSFNQVYVACDTVGLSSARLWAVDRLGRPAGILDDLLATQADYSSKTTTFLRQQILSEALKRISDGVYTGGQEVAGAAVVDGEANDIAGRNPNEGHDDNKPLKSSPVSLEEAQVLAFFVCTMAAIHVSLLIYHVVVVGQFQRGQRQ